MDDKPKYKRRIVIIKRALQFKYIAVVLIAMVLVAFTVGWDVYYTVGRAIMELEAPGLYPIMVKINNLMLGKLAVLLVIVFIIAIFVSHKFAGPIFKFERSCDTVAEGDLTYRVHLRSGDELIELQNKFNGMVSEIQKKVSADYESAKITGVKLSAISARLSQKNVSPAELSEILGQIDGLIAQLNKISSGFKI
ncbi:MAG: HAMP domain-containing protein [Elusimicrobia bacterium]|nr:HAMP domain-containing protein [Elusimicrobiota bacterium]